MIDSLALTSGIVWLALFFLICGPIHECAHAFTAWRMGDGTAKLFGRISLDPIVHFDPVGGTLLAASVVLSIFSGGGGVGFGWAKPTPVNPYNLRGRHAQTWVAVAGPVSNLILAALFAVGFRVMWAQGYSVNNQSVPNLITLVFFEGVYLNVILFIFNLLPIPPLDGSHVLLDQVSPRRSRDIGAFFDQYGLMLLIVIVLFAGRVISPFVNPILSLLLGVQVG